MTSHIPDSDLQFFDRPDSGLAKLSSACLFPTLLENSIIYVLKILTSQVLR
jgi:hypothetical protein